MSEIKRSSIPEWQLTVGENLQYYSRHIPGSNALVRQFVGSESEAFEQLLWLPPQRVRQISIDSPLRIPSDPAARGYANKWLKTAVVGIRTNDAMLRYSGPDINVFEAVAYETPNRLHVGISATKAAIFGDINEHQKGFAVRLSSEDACYHAGIYLAEARAFCGISLPALELIEAAVPEEELPTLYPGIKEV